MEPDRTFKSRLLISNVLLARYRTWWSATALVMVFPLRFPPRWPPAALAATRRGVPLERASRAPAPRLAVRARAPALRERLPARTCPHPVASPRIRRSRGRDRPGRPSRGSLAAAPRAVAPRGAPWQGVAHPPRSRL